jgi:hypothetical protein
LDPLDEFLPLLTYIINQSLEKGHVPSQLKHAIIRPLLKKSGLELVMKNYRPVSNLPFLGKALEAAVILQFNEHIEKNKLDDKKQSAYKRHHSTETLLSKIHNDIMLSLDNGDTVMLVMLDLSAAFDTIDQKILTERLKQKYGITNTALKWFESYLHERTQSVSINNDESMHKKLKYGVPQGSKLGPVLFNAYIAPLSKVAEENGVTDHKYADDEQLILAFRPNSYTSRDEAFTKMEKCINEIRAFLQSNKLLNNSDKTEFILIGSKNNLQKVGTKAIKVEESSITSVDTVRNLGVFFDNRMTMEPQIRNMCKKAFLNIRNIAHIRKSLTREDTKTVVHALVTPHLDYGNALLYGVNKKYLQKLQVAQNSAARLIEKLKKHDRISHIRKELHWLPIESRIDFKLLNLTWKALNHEAPQYIKDMLNHLSHDNNLRSNAQNLLRIPRSKTRYGDRGFACIAPRLWNRLPGDVRNEKTNASFRRKLKTHLFHNTYQDP